MNTTYIGAIGIFLIAALALTLLYQRQTRQRDRCFLASLLEAIGVLGGAVAGGVFVKTDGVVGLLFRLGALAAVAVPFLLVGAYLRRRRGHVA